MTIKLDLWLWPLDQATDASCTAYLSADEVDRAARFVHASHASQFRAARGRMRKILSGYLNRDPASLNFGYHPQGKPYLKDGPLFNLSHSGRLAALVVGGDCELGIDIEAFRPVEHDIADRFFSPIEVMSLNAIPPDQWVDGFFRCWTRKEAVIKALGPGLSVPLNSFDVTLLPDAKAQVSRIEGQKTGPDDWKLIHLDIRGDMVGAIAVASGKRQLSVSVRQGSVKLAL